MAARRNKVVLKSNFAAARKAGSDAIEELIRDATDRMHEVAEQRLERGASKRGYDLPREVEKTTLGKQGRVSYEPFYGRWFEYGTTYIAAMPFIRPGFRAGRKTVKDTAGLVFDKWMTRKARVR